MQGKAAKAPCGGYCGQNPALLVRGLPRAHRCLTRSRGPGAWCQRTGVESVLEPTPWTRLHGPAPDGGGKIRNVFSVCCLSTSP